MTATIIMVWLFLAGIGPLGAGGGPEGPPGADIGSGAGAGIGSGAGAGGAGGSGVATGVGGT